LGIKENLVEWANSWLQTSGINVIRTEYIEEGDTIKTFEIV
jgi:hypothetical protein